MCELGSNTVFIKKYNPENNSKHFTEKWTKFGLITEQYFDHMSASANHDTVVMVMWAVRTNASSAV